MIHIRNLIFGLLCLCLLLSSCQQNSCQLEPTIVYSPPKQLISRLPTSFPRITPEEFRQDWGKELVIGTRFALEMDYYRAITGYKRALFLISAKKYPERKLEIEYGIIQSYYLGGKYQDVIETYEFGAINEAAKKFPAYDDLLIILYDSYKRTGQSDKACLVLQLIEEGNPETAERLQLSEDVKEGNLCAISEAAQEDPNVSIFLTSYACSTKSVKTAQVLNAIFPGAGYYYVGQKQTAITSFLINTLFTAAAYYCFDQGNIAAGLILTSLETGWYFGGINGAGLAAKEFNERLYECSAKEFMLEQRLFPVLMIQHAF